MTKQQYKKVIMDDLRKCKDVGEIKAYAFRHGIRANKSKRILMEERVAERIAERACEDGLVYRDVTHNPLYVSFMHASYR